MNGNYYILYTNKYILVKSLIVIPIKPIISYLNANFELYTEYLPEIRRCRRLLFIACGTSYHSAIAVRGVMWSHLISLTSPSRTSHPLTPPYTPYTFLISYYYYIPLVRNTTYYNSLKCKTTPTLQNHSFFSCRRGNSWKSWLNFQLWWTSPPTFLTELRPFLGTTSVSSSVNLVALLFICLYLA